MSNIEVGNVPKLLAVALNRQEVEALLTALDGAAWIMAMLLYG